MNWRVAGLLLLVAACAILAQPSFTRVQVLTNKEVLLRLNSSNGLNYRIDASTNLRNSIRC